MTNSTPINAVLTTLSIIEALADYGTPVGVSELAGRVGENKPRTYRHLRTLLDREYVTQDSKSGKYSLTLKLFHIGQAVASDTTFLNVASDVMAELRERTGQTVTIGQVEEQGVRILNILRHRSAIEIVTPPGTLFDFHASAQGKIALAFGPRQLAKTVLERSLRPYTDNTCTTPAALRADIDTAFRNGWAVAPEETLMGINALAAPVFAADGLLAGTISIVASIQHLPAQPETHLLSAVIDAAATISDRLGYRKVKTA
jgi:DNA-binding IclR family transcriptional regulator